MKVGILTQPLHHNYGGLLQAYALQHFLAQQGHDVLTVDFSKTYSPRLGGVASIAKNSIKKYLLRNNIKSVFPLQEKEKRKICQHTNRFIAENIRRTQLITDLNELSYLNSYNFDAFIVGSDQVWRPSYSPGLSAFFLEFLESNESIKRIAYAASFGVDNCDEFTKDELNNFSLLAKKFTAIGVREDSAIDLCEKYFGVQAEHVLDPTLLLSKEDYINLIEKDHTTKIDGDMMAYVLDMTEEKKKIIDEVKNKHGLTPYYIMPHDVNDAYPPVTKWLKGFMNAKFVVTDSFHGVVFSIIFNKPFIAIGNNGRGLTRFTSILKLFNLESRLISSLNEASIGIFNNPIDYSKVNEILLNEQVKSMKFLQNALDDN